MAVVSLRHKQARQAAALSGLTRSLASFITGLTGDAIPSSVEAVLNKALIDSIGCGLFGLTTQWGRLVQEFAQEQGGPGESSLWCGAGGKASAMNTVLAAGTAIHGFDFDDHSRAKIHPGAVVVPTALALAQRQRSPGHKLLAAIAAGYETMPE